LLLAVLSQWQHPLGREVHQQTKDMLQELIPSQAQQQQQQQQQQCLDQWPSLSSSSSSSSSQLPKVVGGRSSSMQAYQVPLAAATAAAVASKPLVEAAMMHQGLQLQQLAQHDLAAAAAGEAAD
jgi:hypothetical protein